MITTKKYIINFEYDSPDILSVLILYNGKQIINSKVLYNTIIDIVNGLIYLYTDKCPFFYTFPLRSTMYKYLLYANFSFIDELYSIKVIKEKMVENSVDELIIDEKFELYELHNLINEIMSLNTVSIYGG